MSSPPGALTYRGGEHPRDGWGLLISAHLLLLVSWICSGPSHQPRLCDGFPVLQYILSAGPLLAPSFTVCHGTFGDFRSFRSLQKWWSRLRTIPWMWCLGVFAMVLNPLSHKSVPILANTPYPTLCPTSPWFGTQGFTFTWALSELTGMC